MPTAKVEPLSRPYRNRAANPNETALSVKQPKKRCAPIKGIGGILPGWQRDASQVNGWLSFVKKNLKKTSQIQYSKLQFFLFKPKKYQFHWLHMAFEMYFINRNIKLIFFMSMSWLLMLKAPCLAKIFYEWIIIIHRFSLYFFHRRRRQCFARETIISSLSNWFLLFSTLSFTWCVSLGF